MSAVAYPHIETTDDGVPIIAGTTTKVVEIVLDRLAHHWDADEIRRQVVLIRVCGSGAGHESRVAGDGDAPTSPDRTLPSRLSLSEVATSLAVADSVQVSGQVLPSESDDVVDRQLRSALFAVAPSGLPSGFRRYFPGLKPPGYSPLSLRDYQHA
jgi:hypothetical protein